MNLQTIKTFEFKDAFSIPHLNHQNNISSAFRPALGPSTHIRKHKPKNILSDVRHLLLWSLQHHCYYLWPQLVKRSLNQRHQIEEARVGYLHRWQVVSPYHDLISKG